MTQKTALFSKKGHQIQQKVPDNTSDLIVLSISDPEPVEAPNLDQNICDDPNTPFVDESLPLPEMRYQQYEHERMVRFWKYTKWGVLIILILVLFSIGYLIRDLNKVVNAISIKWDDAIIHNDEDNESLVIDKMNLTFTFQNQGWFHGVLNRGFQYKIEDSTSIELINKPSWFSWARTYESLALIDTNGLHDKLEVVDGQYELKLKNINVGLYEEAHRFLNDLLGQRGKADVLISTKVTLWDKITIPVRSKMNIEKSSTDGIINELMSDVIVKNIKLKEYNEDILSGHALIGLKAIDGIKLNNFGIPANQIHIGAKVKGKFIKLVSIEAEKFVIDETMNDMIFKIPIIDEQLIKSGFIQKMISDIEKGFNVSVWLRTGYCKDNWLCDVVHGTDIELSINPMMFSDFNEPLEQFNMAMETISVTSVNDQINMDSIFEITGGDLNIPFDANITGGITLNGFDINIGKETPLMVNSDNETISVEFNDLAIKIGNESAILESIDSIINGDIPLLNLGFNVESQIQSAMIDGLFKFNFETNVNSSNSGFEFPLPMANISAHLEYVEITEHSNDTLAMIAHVNVTNPFAIDIVNEIGGISFDVEYSLGTSIVGVTILPFTLTRSNYGIIQVCVKLKDESPVIKHHMEEFIGKCISSENLQFSLRGKSLSDSKKFSGLMEQVLAPVSIANGTINGANDFILDTTMHLFGKSVEVIVLNPIEDQDIDLIISEAHASYEGELVGEIPNAQYLKIPSGVYKTPPMPVEFADSGAGWRVVREALKSGQVVPVDVLALVQADIGGYQLDLLYRGQRVLSKIRI